MKFVKMEGLGNDYLFLNCLKGGRRTYPQLAMTISVRHFGMGADGLICVKPGWAGDFAMEMYNADGSQGAMCGNGVRYLGKFVYDGCLTRKRCPTIQTDADSRGLELLVQNGQVAEVTVDMGLDNVEGGGILTDSDGDSWGYVGGHGQPPRGGLLHRVDMRRRRPGWAPCWRVVLNCASGGTLSF